ncbi:MAG: radical SAM protein [Deltaproteobacteria bacterium]|nr:radical SAM protein [Deltaproteobacteria bacterium]
MLRGPEERAVVPLTEDIVWVGTPEGRPPALAAVTVYGHRQRVSVNPSYGCPLGCGYCILAGDGLGDPTRVTPLARVERVLDVLSTHRDAVGDLALHLFDHSDPFLSANEEATAALVEGLARRGFLNQVSLTSKVPPALATLRRIARCDGPAVTVYASLADTSGRVERVPPEARVALLRLAREAGLRAVLLLRPLHPAWTSLPQLAPYLRALRGSVDEVVLTGLRVDHATQALLAARGVEVPVGPPGASLLDPRFADEVARCVDENLPGVPLSRRRSCAANRLHQRDCRKRTGHPRAPSTDAEGGSLARFRDSRGYCLVGPERAAPAAFTRTQALALEALAARFAEAPALRWALDGDTAACALGLSGAPRELTARVHPEDLPRAVERALQTASAQRCDPGCSSGSSYRYGPAWEPPLPPAPPGPEDPDVPRVEDTDVLLRGVDGGYASVRLRGREEHLAALRWVPLGPLRVPVWDPSGSALDAAVPEAALPALVRIDRLLRHRGPGATR